jgi:ABC-type branched-subunit amino acid transport system permease subunit
MTLSLVYGVYWALLCLVFFAGGAAFAYYYERRSTTSGESGDAEVKPHEASHPLALSLPLGMLLGFTVATVASWLSERSTTIAPALLALLIIIVVRRLTADLKADRKKGKGTIRMLAQRFLFDQLLER